ncbi:MAG: hypothetical protein ACE5Z5_06520 [Candidatus Bathyarchaeia archaeon]
MADLISMKAFSTKKATATTATKPKAKASMYSATRFLYLRRR